MKYWPREKPVPTKEEIFAIDGAAELQSILEQLQASAESIRVSLEYPPEDSDKDWDRRARAALTVYQIAVKHTVNRIRQLTGNKRGDLTQSITDKIRSQQKQKERAANKLRHQELQAEQAKSKADRAAISARTQQIAILRDVSFHRAFYLTARRTLPPETLNLIEREAAAEHDRRLGALLGDR